jgi:hypothetical protein
MENLTKSKLKTPLGISLLSGLATRDGSEDNDLIDYLKQSSPTPVQAIGLLIRVASVLIVQCLDRGLDDRELEDCGTVLKETIKHYHQTKDRVGMREVVQRGSMQ